MCLLTITFSVSLSSCAIGLYAAVALIIIVLLCPALFIHWQNYKETIHGPWDEAVPKFGWNIIYNNFWNMFPQYIVWIKICKLNSFLIEKYKKGLNKKRSFVIRRYTWRLYFWEFESILIDVMILFSNVSKLNIKYQIEHVKRYCFSKSFLKQERMRILRKNSFDCLIPDLCKNFYSFIVKIFSLRYSTSFQ